ncbi:MAG: mechanosensitive ion channel [Candidatus Omnitrophica bacterium]|nr:mechanosensitive ion channel [Candidatus Omnitrophota bacterium]
MVDTIYGYVLTYGINIIAALLIFIIGKWLSHMAVGFVEQVMLKANMEKTLTSFTRHIVYAGLITFVFIAALNRLGIQTTSFIAIIGAAGLAVGLALQGSLSNFAAGVMLIIVKPFKVGDFIEAAGAMGTVREIQIFNTLLDAPDNRRIVVPNSKITADNITNFSGIEKRRVDLVFSISYGDDMRKAKEVLEQVIVADARVLKDPKPVIAVSALAESSVDLVCRPWVKPQDYWAVYFYMLETGKLALEKNGMTIPFPQRDVHLYNNAAK